MNVCTAADEVKGYKYGVSRRNGIAAIPVLEGDRRTRNSRMRSNRLHVGEWARGQFAWCVRKPQEDLPL